MGLGSMLRQEQERMENIIQIAKTRLVDVPEGTLRVSKSNNYVQYYHCAEGHKKGKYISKKEEGLAQKLAQKSYDEKVLRVAQKRLNQIQKIVKDYEDDEIEKIYYEMHKDKKALIQTIEPTWEEKMNRWKAEEYQGKAFSGDVPVILTERGERVRSKSEKIMADYFNRNNLNYKYECPLYLKGLGIVYPDFTFLSRKNGEEIYWEHNGMVDNPVYARNMVRKIQGYENNGIFVGEKLILTYETEQSVLNTEKIAQMVKRYLEVY